MEGNKFRLTGKLGIKTTKEEIEKLIKPILEISFLATNIITDHYPSIKNYDITFRFTIED
jgi:hypothetical protein